MLALAVAYAPQRRLQATIWTGTKEIVAVL